MLIHDDPAHRRAGRMPDVRISHTVLPRRATDAHLDNLSCLSSIHQRNSFWLGLQSPVFAVDGVPVLDAGSGVSRGRGQCGH